MTDIAGDDLTRARLVVDDAIREHTDAIAEGRDPGLLVPDVIVRHVALALAKDRQWMTDAMAATCQLEREAREVITLPEFIPLSFPTEEEIAVAAKRLLQAQRAREATK